MTAVTHTDRLPSQTLSRGIRVLELLAACAAPLSIDETADRLGVHRSIAYRLLRTLEGHGLVRRDPAGHYELGAQLAALASAVAHDLQAEALPELTEAANALGVTCFLTVLDRDECVTLTSIEPRHAVASVAQRPGTRHPVTVGAPGKATLAQLPITDWPTDAPAHLADAVAAVREWGWATSSNEVIDNLRAVAVPLPLRGRAPSALAAVYVASSHSDAAIAARLQAAAEGIRQNLGG